MSHQSTFGEIEAFSPLGIRHCFGQGSRRIWQPVPSRVGNTSPSKAPPRVGAARAAGHAVIAAGCDPAKVSAAIGQDDDLMAIKLDITRLQDAQDAVATAIAKFGPMNVTRAVLPVMRRQHAGLVLTISSTAGISGLSFCPAHAAAKFGVDGWMESLTPETALRPHFATSKEPTANRGGRRYLPYAFTEQSYSRNNFRDPGADESAHPARAVLASPPSSTNSHRCATKVRSP